MRLKEEIRRDIAEVVRQADEQEMVGKDRLWFMYIQLERMGWLDAFTDPNQVVATARDLGFLVIGVEIHGEEA